MGFNLFNEISKIFNFVKDDFKNINTYLSFLSKNDKQHKLYIRKFNKERKLRNRINDEI